MSVAQQRTEFNAGLGPTLAAVADHPVRQTSPKPSSRAGSRCEADQTPSAVSPFGDLGLVLIK